MTDAAQLGTATGIVVIWILVVYIPWKAYMLSTFLGRRTAKWQLHVMKAVCKRKPSKQGWAGFAALCGQLFLVGASEFGMPFPRDGDILDAMLVAMARSWWEPFQFRDHHKLRGDVLQRIR